jgi:class 3 adenylate cyclase/predicted ATPase
MNNLPVRIFVSYSHADAGYLGDGSLLGYLRGLEREENARFWTDERIAAGDKWDDEIRANIAQADIALVLVSQRFLDSEYCTNVEVAGFLDRRRKAGLIIFPVILSPCEWKRYPWLRSTQYLPHGERTIEEDYVEEGPRKRLWLDIRVDLRVQIEKVRQNRLTPPSATRSSAAKHIIGERRRVTALECELTAMGGSAAVDPEEIIEVLTQYRSLTTEIVTRLKGDVAQWQGRRLLAYFGNPKVHEDDALRAVMAAREILRLPKNFDGGRSSLAMKVAIHTGSVIVTFAPEGSAPIVVGDIADVAVTVLNLTPPNRIYLTAPTEELIEKDYHCTAAGTVELKDRGRSLQLFALEGDEAEDTTAVNVPARKTLVGRDHELQILRQRWELAREGDGQVVCIRGEGGIGKSRLVQELRVDVASEPTMLWLECRCSPYHENTELYPLIDLLQRALAFANREQQTSAAQRLEDIVRRAGMSLETAMPLLCALLSLPLGPGYRPLNLSAEGRRKQTLAVVLDLILKLAARQPVLMIVEDLHWIDVSTIGFLDQLIMALPTAPVLTVLTFRPDFNRPWGQLSYLSELSLPRLASKETGALISLLTRGKALPHDLFEQIVEKSDGIPLFAEELTKMVTESEVVEAAKDRYVVTSGEKLGIPSTLKGWLLARLDRLGTAKGIAQVASVIGREVFMDLLLDVVEVGQADLARDLECLVQSEIILRRGLPSNNVYFFKHALIQQAAYESVLNRDARQLHGKIAEVLESKFPDLSERQPEVVAFHFERAELPERAIDYWQRAAERSIKNSANIEAIAHLKRGLKLLASLPESRAKDRREMQLRTDLALPLIATKGYSAVEVDEELSRAKYLCAEVGDDAELFRVVRLHWPFLSMRGDHRKAFEAAEQLLAMAEKHDAPHLLLEAHRTVASTLFYMGRMGEARQHFDRAIGFYDRERDHANVRVYGQDPGVSCLANECPTLWFLGCREQALDTAMKAISLARELGHPYSLCYALLFCSWPCVFGRDIDTLDKRMEEMVGVARHQSFALWETIGSILFGWIATQRGAAAAGLITMTDGLARWGQLGARVFVPTFRFLMAEVHAREGDVDAALAAVQDGLAVGEDTGEAFCRAELCGLKRELTSRGRRAPRS